MPNLTAHIDLALECVGELRHPDLQANLGSYILGSCSPDIRIITHGHRDDTHFAPVSNHVIGAGARGLFKAYPQLAKPYDVSIRTRAFLAGYISHLVADEAWIILIYRPYFGNRELIDDHVMANIMDRAIQLEMDRQAGASRDGMQGVRALLADAHVGVAVDFLPTERLAEWRDWVVSFTQREFTWERLRFMARRQFPQDDGTAQAKAEQFIKSLPGGLERVYALVPREALRAYREATVQEWSKLVQEYLA